MEKNEFSSLSVTRLSNDDAANLFRWTIDVATPQKPLFNEIVRAALEKFETNANPFIDQMNRLRESPLTAQMDTVRKVNKHLMSEIKRIVVFEMESRVETRKTAATSMNYFYKPYWDLSDRPQGNQIKDTTEMVGKYEADADILANAKLLGLDVPMADLKANNSNLSRLYLTRNEEVGGRGASGTDLRPAANETYVQFCGVVEQSLNLMPSDSLQTLFNSMDELRVKAHALLPKPKDKGTDEKK